MSKLNFLLLTCFTVILLACKDETKPIDEGVLTFAIDYPDNKESFFLYHVLPKEMKASIKNNSMELKIKKAAMENTIVINGKSKDISVYYNYGETFQAQLTAKDKERLIKKQPKYTVKLTNEKDTLIGFNIKKALVTDPKNPDKKFAVWYTKEIKFKNPNWFNGFEDIPGVLLKYEIVQYGLKMEFVATKFQRIPVADSLVSLNRPGVEITHSQFDKKIIDLFNSFQ